MDFILYGASGEKYYPEIGFTQKGDGSVSVEFEGHHVLELDDLDDRSRISWRDLACWGISQEKQEERFGPDRSGPGFPYVHLTSEDQIRNPDPSFDHLELFRALIKHLSKLLQSEPERKFLRLYSKHCVEQAEYSTFEESSGLNPVDLWNQTALIPQAWVNWIDNGSTRSERSDFEPFRIDFLLSPDDTVSPNLSVVEIDGVGHFARSELDTAGEKQYTPAMDKYTEHVRKDRWLRKQGYDVVRFSTQEVRELADTERGARRIRNRLFDTLRKMSGAWS
ncbi:very-short-patch-repair endonuclease [Salinibacter ruber]|uniref:endonuclease domain-containing protein n=1 Tax=Salinibacter ruber TaxID=146919 RepID=UPI00216A5429|nr:endonuclease domain-containing protein [Salinibacter ruber]MCS3708097.1 very-short-patch-repair endonuclease [Salinibacter ruber]MCS3854731.1 very-short-patch-repair endonuclease [Salinibacter ruber]